MCRKLARPKSFDPRFVGRSFTLIALHFLANWPLIAPVNLNGLRGFCKPESGIAAKMISN